MQAGFPPQMIVYRGDSAETMLRLLSFDIDEGCELLRLSQKAFAEAPQADAFMRAVEWAGRRPRGEEGARAPLAQGAGPPLSWKVRYRSLL